MNSKGFKFSSFLGEASWLVRSTPEGVLVQTFWPGTLCWVLAKTRLMGTGEFTTGGNRAMEHPIQGGSRNTPSRVMLLKPGKTPT